MNKFPIHIMSTAAVREMKTEKTMLIANMPRVARRWLLAAFAAAALPFLFVTPAFAGLPTETWSGGSNTWYEGASGSNGYDWNTNAVWSGGNEIAYFATTPGTVTVSDSVNPVTFNYLYFNSTASGDWDIKGDSLMKYTYTDTSSSSTVVDLGASEKGNVTIDSGLLLDDSGYGPGYFNIVNSSVSGSLTINGPITFYSSKTTTLNSSTGTEDAYGQGRIIYFDGDFENAAATTNAININSAFSMGTSGDTGLILVFGNDTHAGTSAGDSIYNLGSSFDISKISSTSIAINGGTVYDDSANLGSAGITFGHNGSTAAVLGTYHAFLTVGAQTITAGVSDSIKGSAGLGGATIGGSDAYLSTFSGQINLDSTEITLASAGGGRDVFSGQIIGHSPAGIIKSGDGTVVLSHASGNTYTVASDYQTTGVPAGTVAADLQGGTTLITNNSGSAFGNTLTATVNVEGGATLGGTGISRQQVIAEAGTSVITAGVPGQSNFGINPAIGTLTLSGGLTTVGTNGLTFDFKLDGEGTAPGQDSDLISVSNLTLNGTVMVNFTALDSVVTGQAYTLVYGSGTWTGTPTFNILAPTGYVLDTTYNGTGYDFDTSFDTFSVQFALAPEPSVVAMLGLALLALAAVTRWMRRGAVGEFVTGEPERK
jgi:hypothetical protein